MLTWDTPTPSNGMRISLDKKDSIEINIPEHANRIELFLKTCQEPPQFVTKRAKGTYIVSVNRPHLTFQYSKASKVQIPTDQDVSYLNQDLLALKSETVILQFVKIDLQTAKIVVMGDASSTTNSDHNSQLGAVVLVVDNMESCNILHYSSKRLSGLQNTH